MSTYPSIFSLPQFPIPSDGIYTPTLEEQRETEEAIAHAIATQAPATVTPTAASSTTLRKSEHTQFLASTFFSLPSAYVSLDASKPWLLFWTVHSLDLLGVALDQGTKDRAISTLLHYQSPLGGFGGGASNSHLPHLLPTYAAVSSLAIVGNAEPGGGWEQVAAARQDIYDFFMRCKQPDGGFVVCQGGEIDVRGTYCLLVVATLLDLLTPELLHNVDKFIAACQTYEGGFSCSMFEFGATTAGDHPTRVAMAEAHGGYTSCSLFSHFLLSSIVPPEPLPSLGPGFPQNIDVLSAVRWSAFMQGEAVEAGGFRGRSNKLVDGCYGWWVGGGFPVLEELARRDVNERVNEKPVEEPKIAVIDDDDAAGEASGDWVDEPPAKTLFNRVALQEFVLLAAQREAGLTGGLRDKPGKRPDLYHTCNNLSGLSVAQHHMSHSSTAVATNRGVFDASRGLPAVKTVKPEGDWASEEERQRMRREVWSNILGWVEDEAGELILGGSESRVNTTTPVFNILGLRLRPFVNYFYGQ